MVGLCAVNMLPDVPGAFSLLSPLARKAAAPWDQQCRKQAMGEHPAWCPVFTLPKMETTMEILIVRMRKLLMMC